MRKFIALILISALLLLLPSCDLQVPETRNYSQPDESLQSLLTSTEKELAGLMAGDASMVTGIFCNYFDGTAGFPLAVSNYQPGESGFSDSLWQHYYLNVLVKLNRVIKQADNNQSPYYSGMAKTLEALALGNITSFWGDVPFSQSLAGVKNINPGYDRQEDLYERIQFLLDDAIADFSNSQSIFVPSKDDVLYNGNISKWTKACHALKARFFMHLVKRDANAPSKALQALAGGLSSTDDDMQVSADVLSASALNWWLYFSGGSLQIDPSFISMMMNLSDPRLPEYTVKSGTSYILGPYFSAFNYKVTLVGFTEQEFIKTEIYLRNNELVAAKNTFRNAIKTSISVITQNAIDPVILDSVCSMYSTLNGNFNSNLSKIIVHKYIAMFPQSEVWSDFRRTGYPDHKINTNGVNPQNSNGAIPRRLLYPESEKALNNNIPNPLPNLQTRFWWDEL